ncbi:hypothetical protein SAMN05216349_104125 [Oribacterium sp. KHPX15]|uniref:hypothetical protein n=1 Tax=Oribacterium sp. KHPX15 TaxID=1855342 RepID=UPI00089BB225|nr:hypothetical protein [Oribacterium sp. KHPX15]SEA07374.1 hypothetical protein SAMN05216349_104125 [Oribacterium sp. KHPX15]
MRFRRLFVSYSILILIIASLAVIFSDIEIKKRVIDKQQFIMAAKEAGFEVTDDTDLFEGVRGLATALNASNRDSSLTYQFYVFDDRNTADDEFDIFRKTLDSTFVTKDYSSYIGQNYLVYKMEGAKDYHHLCVVDNTLFYAKSPNEEKLQVRDFAKEVGYN